MSEKSYQELPDNGQRTPTQELQAELEPLMEEIISKALEKDRELSYQFASDLRTELARPKRDSESRKESAPARGLTPIAQARPFWRRKATLAIIMLVAAIAFGIAAIPYLFH